MTPASRRRRGVSGKYRRAAAGDSGAVPGPNTSNALDADAVHGVQDWQGIAPGVAVEVHLPGGFSFQGTVDAKTADYGVVWIRSDAGLRQMFGHLEGVRLNPVRTGAR
jgi:hypothetical protein